MVGKVNFASYSSLSYKQFQIVECVGLNVSPKYLFSQIKKFAACCYHSKCDVRVGLGTAH